MLRRLQDESRVGVALLLFALAPFLGGARGCIETLAVGLEQDLSATPDAGPGDDAGGGEPYCDPSACGEAVPEPRECAGGVLVPAECVHHGEVCLWDLPPCPPLEDGGVGPCQPEECTGPILLATPEGTPTDPPNCGKDREPVCRRDSSGLCTLQCEAPCGIPGGMICGEDEFCVLPFGRCAKGDEGGVCQKKPEACTVAYAPVCGCDGTTYGSLCEAFAAGASVAFEGECASVPTPCAPDQCPAIRADEPTMTCPDDVHQSGPVCVQTSGGSCVWQWLDCPTQGTCIEFADQHPAPETGTCWIDEQCEPGQRCVGAEVCPCEAQCFRGDTPGTCM